MSENNKLVYSIIFDVPKEDLIKVKEFTEGIKECLSALEEFNRAIAGSVDSSIEVVSYIQELKNGSIDFNIIDEIAKGFLNGVGVAGVGGLSLVLLKTKAIFFKINQEKITKEEKKKKIAQEIKKEIEGSGLNNILKGYLLDEKRLMKAVGDFAKGVKKTQDNVFFKENQNSEKIHINSSLYEEEKINEIIEDENSITRIEETTIRITISVLDGKSKWGIYWNKRIKAEIQDEEFKKKVQNGYKIGSKQRFKVKMKIIEKLDENKNIIDNKEEYIILKVDEIEEFTAPNLSF